MVNYSNRRQKLKLTHGDDVAKAYAAWVEMRRRCRHPDESRGNGCYNGITFCDRWNSFDAFLKDMGTPKSDESLDRIEYKGDYTPENCRWANATVQSRNRGYVKLSMEKAEQIRNMYAAGNISQQKIADLFGVSQLLVSRVIRKLQWI